METQCHSVSHVFGTQCHHVTSNKVRLSIILCTLTSHICLGIISKSQIKIGFYFTQKMKPNPCFPGLQLCLTKETKTRNIWISESDLGSDTGLGISRTHRVLFKHFSGKFWFLSEGEKSQSSRAIIVFVEIWNVPSAHFVITEPLAFVSILDWEEERNGGVRHLIIRSPCHFR